MGRERFFGLEITAIAFPTPQDYSGGQIQRAVKRQLERICDPRSPPPVPTGSRQAADPFTLGPAAAFLGDRRGARRLTALFEASSYFQRLATERTPVEKLFACKIVLSQCLREMFTRVFGPIPPVFLYR